MAGKRSRTRRREEEGEDDDRPTPSSRVVSKTTPTWVWLALAAGTWLVAVGGVGSIWLVSNVGKNDMKNATVFEPRAGHRIGDVTVSVVECSESLIEGRDVIDRPQITEHHCGKIVLNYRNSNPAKNAVISAQTNRAIIVDDLGNRLEHLDLTFDVDGQITPSSVYGASLRSDGMVQDVLVFRRPVPAARSVTLFIDKSQFSGEKGYLKCDIPIAGKFRSK